MLNRGVLLQGKDNTATIRCFDSVRRSCSNRKEDFYKKKYIETLRNTGYYYIDIGRYDTAKQILNGALQEAVSQNYPQLIARVYITLGIVADHQSDYETSVAMGMKALNYYEQDENKYGQFLVNGNLGNTYIKLRQYNKAVEVITKAIDLGLSKDLGQATLIKRQTANCMNNLARAYKYLGNKPRELELKLRAFDIFRAEEYKSGLATVSMNLGNFYENEDQLDESYKYYTIALENCWATGDQGHLSILYGNMVDLYIKRGEPDKAMLCADSSLYFSKLSGDRLSYAESLEIKAKMFALQNNYAAAYNWHIAYASLRDTLSDEQMQYKVAGMEVKYETEKKQARISLLTKESIIKNLQLKTQALEIEANDLVLNEHLIHLVNDSLELQNKTENILRQQQENKLQAEEVQRLHQQSLIKQLEIDKRTLEARRKNLVVGLLFITLLLVALTGYVYYRRFKLRKEEQLNRVVAEQQKLATRALFEGEQKERMRIARDLHDSIGQMLSVAKMQLSSLPQTLETKEQEQIMATQSLLDKTIQEVRHISHNLIPEELDFGLINALEELSDKINKTEGVAVQVNVSEELSSYTFNKQFELSLYRIIQEIISNMLRHAQAKEISISLQQKEKLLLLDIRDDGKGFDPSSITETKGLGWKNILARVSLLNGKMDIHSERIKGTQIQITLPQ
jgi:two-component system NarL family sensor kinase